MIRSVFHVGIHAALAVMLVLATGCSEAPAPAESTADAAPATQAASGAPVAAAEPVAPDGATEPAAPADEPTSDTAAPTEPPAEDALTFVSNDGRYRIVCQVLADPIEINQPFGMDVWVLDPESGEPAAYDAISIDAAMPHHRHGMNQYPEVTKVADGRHHVDGMLFHMLGYWEIYVDVADGPVVERGQVSVDVE